MASDLLPYVFPCFLRLDQKDFGHGGPEPTAVCSLMVVFCLSGSRRDRLGDRVCCLPAAAIFTDLTSIIAPVGPSADHLLYREKF